METQATLDKVAERKANRDRIKEIRASIRSGCPLPGCSYFVWGEGLYYGDTPKIKTSGQLLGLYVCIANADEDDLLTVTAIKRVAKTLNASALAPEKQS